MASRIDRDGGFMRKLDSNIRTWEAQFQGEQGLQSARQTAQAGTAGRFANGNFSGKFRFRESSSLSSQASEAI